MSNTLSSKTWNKQLIVINVFLVSFAYIVFNDSWFAKSMLVNRNNTTRYSSSSSPDVSTSSSERTPSPPVDLEFDVDDALNTSPSPSRGDDFVGYKAFFDRKLEYMVKLLIFIVVTIMLIYFNIK